ncbi:2Fe-2S iron-sulfur cluster-binding protein [Flavobacteriales bacterium]|nr:2Fe-2S iron-sulfur cluster-binding protein [Flavobacteriales bacterium]
MWSSVTLHRRHKITSDSTEVAILPRMGRVRFTPGQFIVLEIQFENATRRSAFSIVRQEGRGIIIGVKINGTQGISSLLNQTETPIKAHIAGPFGDFALFEDLTSHVFVAGGSGITPVRSLLDTLFERGIVPTIIYANTDRENVMYGRSLRLLNEKGYIKLTEVFDRNIQAALVGIPTKDTAFYACGSSGLVQSCVDVLDTMGVPPDRVRTENYGLAMGGGDQESKGFRWKGRLRKVQDVAQLPGESILTSALKAEIPIPHACEVGACGACLVHLQEGQVFCGKELKNEGEEILACVSIPTGTTPPLIQAKRGGRAELVSIAMVIAAIAIGFWSLPPGLGLRAKGPMNVSHNSLQCEACHKEAQGSIRQQMGHNTRGFFGLHDMDMVSVGFEEVDNNACLDCHDRPNDLHPTSRFMEPQFADLRTALNVHECNGCHGEHQGKRVANIGIQLCKNCHQDMEVPYDKTVPTHAQLKEEEAWETCMSCHDFHGNHMTDIPNRLQDGVSTEALLDYMDGGPDPYSEEKHHAAQVQP